MTCRRRAFTITELLAVLILLTVFSLIAGKLFHATFTLARTASQTQDAIATFDSAVAAIRADVWSARKLDVQPQSINLGGTTWKIAGADLSRTEGERIRRWTVSPGMTFRSEGPVLVMILPESKTTHGGEVRMLSQVQLLARLTQ